MNQHAHVPQWAQWDDLTSAAAALGPGKQARIQGHCGPCAGPGALPAAAPGPTLTLPAQCHPRVSKLADGEEEGASRCPPWAASPGLPVSSVLSLGCDSLAPAKPVSRFRLLWSLSRSQAKLGHLWGRWLWSKAGWGGFMVEHPPRVEPGEPKQSPWMLGSHRTQPARPSFLDTLGGTFCLCPFYRWALRPSSRGPGTACGTDSRART